MSKLLKAAAAIAVPLITAGSLASCSKEPDQQGATEVGRQFAEALNQGDSGAITKMAASPEDKPRPLDELVGDALKKYGKKGIEVSRVKVVSEVAERASLRVPLGSKLLIWPLDWNRDAEEWKVVLGDPIVSGG